MAASGTSPVDSDTGIVGSAALTLAFRGLMFGLTLLANVILARALGPTDRGIYAIAVLVPSLLSLLANLGLASASVYHVSRASLDKRYVVGTSLAVALVIGVLVYGLLFAATGLSVRQSLFGVESRYLQIAGASLPFLLVAAYMQGVLHGEKRFFHLNLVVVSQSLTLTGLLAVMVLTHFDRLTTAVVAWTFSTAIAAFLAVFLVARRTSISLATNLSTLRELLRYGSLTYLSTLNSFVNYRFDQLLVNALAGATQVGLYAVGTGVAEVIWFIPNAVTIALAPRVAAASEAEASRISAQAARTVLVITLAAAALMALLALPAIVLFFGNAFRASAYAVWLLLPGVVTFSVWKVLSCYLQGRNLLRQDLVATTAAMVLTLVLDLSLIPAFGFRGAAIASSVAYTGAMVVDIIWVTRRTHLSAAHWLIAGMSDARSLRSSLRAMKNDGRNQS